MRFRWRRLCHVSDGTNVALALGGLRSATIRTIQIVAPATHSRYARWSKWRVRRPFRCPLIGRPNAARCQNGGTRLCQLCLFRRERELWQPSTISLGKRPRAAAYGTNSGAIQLCSCSRFTRLSLVIDLPGHRQVAQSWSRVLETEYRHPRRGPGGRRREARVSRAAMPKRPLQCSAGNSTKRVSSRLLPQTC